VRRTRDDETIRLDKASRKAKVGDELVFILGGRLVDLRVEALGVRRGPASEARGLYSAQNSPSPLAGEGVAAGDG
jgi:ribosomal 50S subunit-recycling heat shock protein